MVFLRPFWSGKYLYDSLIFCSSAFDPVCCLAETEPQLLGAFNKVAATNFRDDVDDGIALHVVPTSKLEKSQRKAMQTAAGGVEAG